MGWARARISGVGGMYGDSLTIAVEMASDAATPIASAFALRTAFSTSVAAMANPSSTIGPIIGAISMAPMITAAELSISPSVAMPHEATTRKTKE